MGGYGMMILVLVLLFVAVGAVAVLGTDKATEESRSGEESDSS